MALSSVHREPLPRGRYILFRYNLLPLVTSQRFLPLQQVVYGLEQEGPALVGQPALPQPLLRH